MSLAEDLERDIGAFADPATEVSIKEASGGALFVFFRNGEEHEYFLSRADGSVTDRRVRNKRYVSVRSLLSSRDFADIRGFATTQARMYREFDVDSLLPPEGHFSDGKRVSFQAIQKAWQPQAATDSSASISIHLLDGPAGIGKTSLIERVLVHRARSQPESTASPPILHVTNRGRRLTALDDALAQSLQLIRAQFTFDQVPTLIRHQLIQLAIDGFDELVDPEGYKDAWFALRDFLEVTGFGGPIVLAGRDTFFDEQTFLKQIGESRLDVSLSHVRLDAVSSSTAKKWLSTQGWRDKDLADPFTDLILRPGSYALRPYFLRELAKAKNWRSIETGDLTPRAYLVDRFIAREADLLAQRLSIGSAEVKGRLASIFEEIAIEMADTDTDAIDLSFLQMATELSFGDLLDKPNLAKLRHKAGSFALLESDAREGFRRFPHTEISHHFLAQGLIRLVSAGGSFRFLRRGIVSADLLTILAEIMLSSPSADVERFVSNLESLLGQQATFDRLAENAASLLVTCLCRTIGSGKRVYQDLQISSAVLFGVVAPSRLERVRLLRLDAEEASLGQMEFIDCEVDNLQVDETTRFGTTVPKVHQIHARSQRGVIKDIFDPVDIDKWIEAHMERPVVREASNAAALKLLDRVCRIMLRQHMIKDHESDESGRVLRNEYWPEVEAILLESGFIERVRGKSMAGTKAPFLRMRDPYSLLVHRGNPKIRAVWDKVGAIQEP